MMKRVDLSVAPFALQVSNSKSEGGCSGDEEAEEAKASIEKTQQQPSVPDAARNGTIRYRECMKNHAASIGGHANDGCGEFMPGGEGFTLKCAACGCHRNFHRKDAASASAGTGGDHYILHTPPAGMVVWDHKRVFERLPYISALPMPPPPPPPPPHALTTTPSPHHHHHFYGGGVELRGQNESREDRRSETPDGRVEVVGLLKSNNKRFRTKFTQEQKEKMMEFAEKLGWRIQRHDDTALNDFCSEIGVKRRVLKVWMHNNKSTLGRKRDDIGPSVQQPPIPPTADDDDDEDDDDDAVAVHEDDNAAQSPVGG